jgi:hypothetical protein
MNNKFVPRGAIASFLGLMILYVVIWYALYFVAVSRG